MCLSVRKVNHLGYRQTEGFVESFLRCLDLELPVPCYTQLCRRSAHLPIRLKTKKAKEYHRYCGGLNRFKSLSGRGKQRTWRKLYVALNGEEQQVEAVELTTNAVEDGQAVEALAGSIEAVIRSFTGDGAYDQKGITEYLHQKAIEHGEDMLQCIPPRHQAVPDTRDRVYLQKCNEDVMAMRPLGRRQWKILTNNHR